MPLTRSENMSRIRSSGTEPELIVRRALYRSGFRYRLQQRTPGGKADLVIPAQRFALFIDGCFWHGCPEHYVHPRSNWPFWDKKLRENVDRDRRQTLALINEGWRFLRVWEHEVREDPEAVTARIRKVLLGGRRASGGLRVVFVRPVAADSAEEKRLHEDLLNPARTVVTIRERTTAKRGRVQLGLVSSMSAPGAMPPRRGETHGRKSGRNGAS